MTESVTALLTPAHAAGQLDTNENSVLRLIARGELKATAVPPDKWRIIPDDFFGYVRGGLKDYRDLRKGADVITSNSMLFKATELEKAIVRASTDQRLSEKQAEVQARQQRPSAMEKTAAGEPIPAFAELQVTIRLTPSVSAVLNGPISSAFVIPGKTFPVENFGDLFLAEKLREQIEKQYRAAKRQTPTKEQDPLVWLYGQGPEAYTTIVQEAARQVATDAITFDENHRFPDRGEGAISVHVVYRLPNSLWATSTRLAAVAKSLL